MRTHKHSFALLLLGGALTLFCPTLQAGHIDTIQVSSPSMKKTVECYVVEPDKASTTHPMPVLYLLHGYGGNAGTWLRIKPQLKDLADTYGMYIVCPDGKNSWYWDSPRNPEMRYETFVSKELITGIDQRYHTIPQRTARAITGLSMGGHGGMWISIRHKDTFGAAGSTSGGVDIRPFPKEWEMSKQLGSEVDHQRVWDEHSAINLIETLKNGDLALIIDCGYSDFFREVNEAFHQKLLKQGIDHDYIVRPGAHTGDYWFNSIDTQLLFFSKYFQNNNTAKL